MRLTAQALVSCAPLREGCDLPVVMRPAVEGVNLVSWAEGNRQSIESELLRYGAVLFRDFTVNSVSHFEQFARTAAGELIKYGERSSPRTKLEGEVYTSTDHPADQHILLHNEQSYTVNWPMKILFYCAQPAQEGGATPIADSRKIYRRLAPGIVEKFAEKKVMYVRNYGHGLGLPWQEVFQTDDRAAVAEHCRRASIEFEWMADNCLRTRQVRPALRQHPKTGETVWFNHSFFFHLSSLEASVRKSMLAVVSEEDVPFNTFYGDGSPIEPSVLEEIREAFRQETVSFPWQQSDVLLLDNMLVAHGREPFAGPRRIVVAMAEPSGGKVND